MAQTCSLLEMRRLRVIGLCSTAVLLFSILTLESLTPVAEAKPFEEIFPSYGHRDLASAITTLKSLENQYNKFSRPRYGKRNVADAGKQFADNSIANLVSNGVISDDWIVVNRALPLSKFSENYLRQLLIQSDRLKAEQQSQQQSQAQHLESMDN